MNGQEPVPSKLSPRPQRPTPSTPSTLEDEDEFWFHPQLLAFLHWTKRKYIRQHAKGEVPPMIHLGKQRIFRKRSVLNCLPPQNPPHPRGAFPAARPRTGKSPKKKTEPADLDHRRALQSLSS